MKISKNKVVSFHYELRDSQGTVLEDNFNDTPSLYMHGADNIISGLETAMNDHQIGDEFEVTLAPEDAYGHVEPNKQERIPAKYLKHEGKMKPGALKYLLKTYAMLLTKKFATATPMVKADISTDIANISLCQIK